MTLQRINTRHRNKSGRRGFKDIVWLATNKEHSQKVRAVFVNALYHTFKAEDTRNKQIFPSYSSKADFWNKMPRPHRRRGSAKFYGKLKPKSLAALDPGLAYRQIDAAFCKDCNCHEIPGQQCTDDEIPGSDRAQQFVPGELFEIKSDKP